jgi:phosphoribosyl-ATP pyrophosphohydrolase/phosphoribosyl-AMP cyclohydrolase
MNEIIEKLRFDENGLIPVIVQDYKTGEVLMLAYMNKEALLKTIETKEGWFFSRSRGKLWHKGETSGNFQKVLNIKIDCDEDAILLIVDQKGNACHTGNYSCFYRGLMDIDANFLIYLENIIRKRKENLPQNSYSAELFRKGKNRIMQKLGEEAIETIISGLLENDDDFINESADLIYHLLVALVLRNLSIKDVINKLVIRHEKSKELGSQ